MGMRGGVKEGWLDGKQTGRPGCGHGPGRIKRPGPSVPRRCRRRHAPLARACAVSRGRPAAAQGTWGTRACVRQAEGPSQHGGREREVRVLAHSRHGRRGHEEGAGGSGPAAGGGVRRAGGSAESAGWAPWCSPACQRTTTMPTVPQQHAIRRTWEPWLLRPPPP